MKQKSTGFWLKLIGGPLGKRLENHENRNLCLRREFLCMKGNSTGFWLQLMGTTLGQRLENHQKGNLCVWRGLPLLIFWAASCFCCWCFELYHGFVADVLSCIRFPLLMSWPVSCFYCWCLELYHAFVADVLSCIKLLLLMFWAVSHFPRWCLALCHFAIAVSSILFIAVSFSFFLKWKQSFEFRVSGWQIPRWWPPQYCVYFSSKL